MVCRHREHGHPHRTVLCDCDLRTAIWERFAHSVANETGPFKQSYAAARAAIVGEGCRSVGTSEHSLSQCMHFARFRDGDRLSCQHLELSPATAPASRTLSSGAPSLSRTQCCCWFRPALLLCTVRVMNCWIRLRTAPWRRLVLASVNCNHVQVATLRQPTSCPLFGPPFTVGRAISAQRLRETRLGTRSSFDSPSARRARRHMLT